MSNFTRRSMLAASLGAVGAGIVSGPSSALATVVPRATGLPRRSQFGALVGSLFTAGAGSARHTLKLVEVLDVRPVTVVGDELAFNLLFEEVSGPRLRDGIYTLTTARMTTARMPACTLFLSPVDLPAHRPRVQALVNSRSS